MSQKLNSLNLYFWLLIGVSSGLVSVGLALSWMYSHTWVKLLGHICRANFQHLQEHLPLTTQLIIPTILLVIIIRGGMSLVRQLWTTQQLTRLFLPLSETPPIRVGVLLAAHRLQNEDIVFLNLPIAHAFCLGFWQPHIWLTTGLVNLLSNEELDAVLAHEAYHCRQRDPLRLLLIRTCKAAFFFLPLIGDLTQAAELQQEVGADRAAIAHLGNDLPLLCTIQKLLETGSADRWPAAAYSPFNVTEARLRRLIYPPRRFSWQIYLTRGLISLGIITILATAALLSVQPGLARTSHCPYEHVASLRTDPYVSMRSRS